MANQFKKWQSKHTDIIANCIDQLVGDGKPFSILQLSEQIPMSRGTIQKKVEELSLARGVELIGVWSDYHDKEIRLRNTEAPPSKYKKSKPQKQRFTCRCITESDEMWLSVSSLTKETVPKDMFKEYPSVTKIVAICTAEEYAKIVSNRSKRIVSRHSAGGSTATKYAGRTRNPY